MHTSARVSARVAALSLAAILALPAIVLAEYLGTDCRHRRHDGHHPVVRLTARGDESRSTPSGTCRRSTSTRWATSKPRRSARMPCRSRRPAPRPRSGFEPMAARCRSRPRPGPSADLVGTGSWSADVFGTGETTDRPVHRSGTPADGTPTVTIDSVSAPSAVTRGAEAQRGQEREAWLRRVGGRHVQLRRLRQAH